MFPEFAHWVKPPFKVLSIPAAKYRSPESSRRPEAFQRIDRLCRLTLRCLDELSVPWYKTMTTVSSIYVTRAVAMNFKIGFWAATGKTANAPLLWRNSWKRRQSHARPSDSVLTWMCGHKTKISIFTQGAFKVTEETFPVSSLGCRCRCSFEGGKQD